MRTSSLRRFLLSCCPPPHYMFGRRTGDSTSSHGGYFSIETYYRLLVEIININRHTDQKAVFLTERLLSPTPERHSFPL